MTEDTRELVLPAPRWFDKLAHLDRIVPDEEKLRSADSVHLDLSQVNYWNPATIVGTLIVAERLRQYLASHSLTSIKLSYPGGPRAAAYASLLGFSEMVLEVLSAKPPAAGHIDLDAKKIIPLTRFVTSGQVEQIANSMANVFQTDLVGLSFLLQPCHIVFSELADNILHHSNATAGWVAAARVRHRLDDGTIKPMVEIAVGDSGIGIPAAIKKNPALSPSDDAQAVVLALQEGVSGLDDPHRGYGLWHLRQEVVRVAAQRVLVIRSGAAQVRVRADGAVRWSLRKRFPGTLAYVMIPYPAASKG